MEQNYNFQIQQAAEHIFEVMRPRTSPEELSFIQHAFQIANSSARVENPISCILSPWLVSWQKICN